MKVLCLVTNFARWEGDPHSPWLVEQALQLRERGVESAVLAPSYKGLGDHEIYGIPVYRFRYFPRRWENLTHLEGGPNKIKNPLYLPLILPYMFFGTLAVIRHCRRQRYDVLHVHWPLPQGIFGLVGQNISGARLVTSFHGAELLLTRRYPFLKPVLRYIVERSDAVSANSSFTASLVRELADVEVKVIPYGSTIVAREVPSMAVGPKPRPERDEGWRILFVGRLIERKGLPDLIEAMDLLLPGLPVQLDIVGAGDQRPLLERLVKDKGLAERVFFRGRIPYEELAELYAGCDVFVLPAIVDSRGDTEGLGVVLVEAMSYKKPVIATNVGGIPDIIRHNETGILVEQRDPQALAQAIEAVLTDDSWARELGQAGFAYVKEYFSWPRIVDQVMALYSPEAEATCPEGVEGACPERSRRACRRSLSRASRRGLPMTVRLRKLLQSLVLAVIAFFLGRALYGNWEEVRTYQWSFDYPLLALSLAVMLASLSLYAWQWRFSLQKLRAVIGFLKVARIYFVANLGRYIPGKVWQFLGWFYLLEQEGVSPVQTLTSMAINQILQNMTGLALAFVVLAGLRSTGLSGRLLPFLMVIPLGLVVIQPFVLERLLNWGLRLFKRRPVVIELTAWDLARFAALHLLIWLGYGLAFYFFIRALYPVPLEWLPALAGIFAGAWVLGFLSFLAPGGLGVREGILVYLLGFYLPSHVAIVVTLLSRLWVTAAELMGTALAFGFDGLGGALPWGHGRVPVEGEGQGAGPDGPG